MKGKISFSAFVFAFSFWLIFVTIEGSFSVQIFLPILPIVMITTIIKSNDFKLKIYKEYKYLFIFIFALTISTIFSFVFYIKYFDFECLIGLLYFVVIFLWYILNANKNYTAKELNFIIRSYIWMSVLCSIFLLSRFLNGQDGKIAMINLLNIEIDENYVSALISVATVYIFIRILNKTNDNIKEKIINILLLAINILGIALSGSRAALLSTMLAMVISFFYAFRFKINIKKIIKLFLILIITIAIGIKILDYIPEWTFNRYFNSNYVDNSNNTRLSLWKNGLNGILNSPFLGYGIRIFHKLPEFKYIINGASTPAGVPAHQTYLDLMLYAGILGFIPFILFLYNIIKIFLKKKNRIFIPVIIVIFLITNIVGAERSVFLWNNIILLALINRFIANGGNIDDIV